MDFIKAIDSPGKYYPPGFFRQLPVMAFGMQFNRFHLYFIDNIYFFSDLFMIFDNYDVFGENLI